MKFLIKKINLKLCLVLIITFYSIFLLLNSIKAPSADSTNENNEYKLNLGLDLSGGVHLLLKVDFATYFKEKYKDISLTFKKQLKQNNFKYQEKEISESFIIFNIKQNNKNTNNILNEIVKNIDLNLMIETINSNNISSAANLNNQVTQTDVNESKEITVKIFYDENYKNQIRTQIVDQTIATLRNRIDSTGTKEPVLQNQGIDKIILEMPGLKSAESLKNAIKKTAKLTFHIVENQKTANNLMLLTQNKEQLFIKESSELTGQEIETANVSFDEYSKPNLAFKLTSKGAKIFAEVTKNNIGNRLAIVLDNTILTAPTINSAIKEGSGVITGNFTIEEANELAIFLKSGSLVAKIDIIEERIIGPTLGEQSIKDAKIASLVALFLVSLSMLIFYRVLGLFANISLVLSLVYMFALLSLFNATLTMPGIAGIILTIGMAVDANILIYERIKEEYKSGVSLLYASTVGFKTAFSTIMDANITTLIVALMLYVYGTGPVRGFAVTLSIGIIASMFSAIIVTKLLIDFWLKYNKKAKISI